MKHAPTLADACIATALDKSMAGMPGPNNQQIRTLLLKVATARKFVLDHDMSGYLCDLSRGFWRGGQRKRFALLENARRMARLPHQLTWIEFEYPAYLQRAQSAHGMSILRPGTVFPTDPLPARVGWLLRQHPGIETAFIASEVADSLIKPGRVQTHPVSIVWCADDAMPPWRTIKLYKDEPDGEYLMMMGGYRSRQVAWTFTWKEELSTGLMRAIRRAAGPAALKPTLLIRDLWALLATINDLPVKIEAVQPSRGYVARGNYKKFLQHSVVHLNVPESQWRKLVAKSAIMLRKRAHQVRGHWRKDWRHPLSVLCEHIFDAEMVCRNCRGRQVWVHEHQRGDASIGFVTHDYEVHQKEAC